MAETQRRSNHDYKPKIIWTSKKNNFVTLETKNTVKFFNLQDYNGELEPVWDWKKTLPFESKVIEWIGNDENKLVALDSKYSNETGKGIIFIMVKVSFP